MGTGAGRYIVDGSNNLMLGNDGPHNQSNISGSFFVNKQLEVLPIGIPDGTPLPTGNFIPYGHYLLVYNPTTGRILPVGG